MNTIVVIDDEYIVIEGIKALVSRLDYEVVGSANDGISGLDIVLTKKPDIVISDIRIPGLDGLSLIETAKEALPNTAFIVISGYTEFEYARRALLLGVKGYIDKPITREKLTDVLNKVESDRLRDEEKRQDKTQVQPVISAIIDEKPDELVLAAEEILKNLRQRSFGLDEYKNEAYKFMCVAGGVYSEQCRQVEAAPLAGYNELEKLDSFEKADSFALDFISLIANQMRQGRHSLTHRAITQLVEYINANFANDIGLNELADMVGMNPAYLSILFKEEIGESFVKYLTRLRLDKARELLAEGKKVADVSAQVGYANYRYFCDIFKKHTGMTPNEYRGHVRR